MTSYQKVKLGELMKKVTDGSHWSPKEQKAGIPMASVKDMTEFGFDIQKCKKITEEDYRKIEKADCKPLINDILIAKDGSYLKYAFVWKKDVELAILSSIAILRPDTTKINPYYFSKVLTAESTKKKMANYVTGSALPRIVLKDFKKMVFDIPDILTQSRIASVLSAYDDLIENNEKRIKVLEEMSQLLYTEWFVKFKFPGYEKVKMVDSGTEYGMIPDGWEVKKLGDKVKISKGKNITKETITEGKIPVVAGGLTPAYYHNIFNATAPVVTISASGANAGYVNLYQENIWASDCSYIDKEITKHVYYFYILLKTRQSEITKKQRGSAQPHVYPKDLMDLKVLNPTESLIDTYEDNAKLLFEMSEKFKKQNKSLYLMRDLLIPQLVTGKRNLK